MLKFPTLPVTYVHDLGTFFNFYYFISKEHNYIEYIIIKKRSIQNYFIHYF